MRQRKNCEWNRGLRGRVLREYDDSEYRALRGRVEAPFGGFARRYASRLHERLASTRKIACLLWAVAHNVRTIARTVKSYWQELLDNLVVIRDRGAYANINTQPILSLQIFRKKGETLVFVPKYSKIEFSRTLLWVVIIALLLDFSIIVGLLIAGFSYMVMDWKYGNYEKKYNELVQIVSKYAEKE